MKNTNTFKKGLIDDMEKDATLHKVKDTEVDQIASLCQQYADLEKDIAKDEKLLKDKQERFKTLSFEVIPNALAERNLSSLKLIDGSEINVTPYYSARITQENQDKAFKWLRDNNHGDLIKNEVTVSFGRGEDDKAGGLMTNLVKQGLEPNQKTRVHPQSLKGFVREQIENGNDLPFDLLGAYAGQRAVVKTTGGK